MDKPSRRDKKSQDKHRKKRGGRIIDNDGDPKDEKEAQIIRKHTAGARLQAPEVVTDDIGGEHEEVEFSPVLAINASQSLDAVPTILTDPDQINRDQGSAAAATPKMPQPGKLRVVDKSPPASQKLAPMSKEPTQQGECRSSVVVLIELSVVQDQGALLCRGERVQ